MARRTPITRWTSRWRPRTEREGVERKPTTAEAAAPQTGAMIAMVLLAR